MAAITRPGAVLGAVASVDALIGDGVLELARLTIDGADDVVAGVEFGALALVAGAEGAEWLAAVEETGAGEVGAGEVGADEVGGGETVLEEPAGEDTGGEDVPDEAGGAVYEPAEDGAGE